MGESSDSDVRDATARMRDANRHMAAATRRDEQASERMAEADRRIVAADESRSAAVEDSAEYDRALYHYTQLVRHRIVNPIQVIGGMAQTMLAMPDLPRERRRELLLAILEQVETLEHVSLEPTAQGEEERELHPRPFE
jgi:hypothetical protein